MNYVNNYEYLCFCCVDAVDCGAGCVNLHGDEWDAPPCGYWIKSSMTDRSGNDGRLSPLPLWIADQVRNDGVIGLSCCHPLIPVSGTGTGSLIPLPSRERVCMVGVVLLSASDHRPSGLRIRSAMTWWSWPRQILSMACPHRLDSRFRGNDGVGVRE